MCAGTGEEEMRDTDKEGQPIMVDHVPDCDGTGEVSNDCDTVWWKWVSSLKSYTEYTVVEEWRISFYVSLE